MKVIKVCLKCNQYMTCEEEATVHKAYNCNGMLQTINIPCKDMYMIEKISTDTNFIQAMIDLKEKDIIEYNLKMSQFRSQLQQKSSELQNDTTPRCPNCRSSKIQKIGGLERAGSVAMFGMFSKKINKSFKCNKCGYTW